MHVGPDKRLARRLAASGAKSLRDSTFADYLSQRDPLQHLREQFSLPTREAVWPELYAKYHGLGTAEELQPAVYLAGNSLGLMPLSTPEFVQQEFEVWSKRYVVGNCCSPAPSEAFAELIDPFSYSQRSFRAHSAPLRSTMDPYRRASH